jgi:hypothetical protein
MKGRVPIRNEDIFVGVKSKASKPLHNAIKHTEDNLALFHKNIRCLAGKSLNVIV